MGNNTGYKDIDSNNLSGAVIGKLIRRANEIDENVSINELIMFTKNSYFSIINYELLDDLTNY